MRSQNVTAIRVTIGKSAEIQGLILETPASIALSTPSAAVQIQVMCTEIDDRRVLPNGCNGHYSHQ